MLVFIDESGCAGFQLQRGSTPYFVVAMVIFADNESANRATGAIQDVRRETGHKAEFKFSKCSNSVRDVFFNRLRTMDFTVRAIVVDKSKISSHHLRTNTEDFYRYFVRLILTHDNDALKAARIRIDGSGDRKFQRELNRYLREQVQCGKIDSVKMKNSANSELIQLADMCVGAIHRRYKHKDDRDDAARWYKSLTPRLGDVWTFPND
jgi:hypothetical protein